MHIIEHSRFSRIAQEQFVDFHEGPLFADLGLLNEKLADWLVKCNQLADHTKGWGYKLRRITLLATKSAICGGLIQVPAVKKSRHGYRDCLILRRLLLLWS